MRCQLSEATWHSLDSSSSEKERNICDEYRLWVARLRHQKDLSWPFVSSPNLPSEIKLLHFHFFLKQQPSVVDEKKEDRTPCVFMQQTTLPANQAVFRFQRNYSCSENRERKIFCHLCLTNWNLTQSSIWNSYRTLFPQHPKLSFVENANWAMSLKCFMLPFLLYKWWNHMVLPHFQRSNCPFDRKEYLYALKHWPEMALCGIVCAVETKFLIKFLLIGLVCLYDSKVW